MGYIGTPGGFQTLEMPDPLPRNGYNTKLNQTTKQPASKEVDK